MSTQQKDDGGLLEKTRVVTEKSGVVGRFAANPMRSVVTERGLYFKCRGDRS